VLAAVFCTINFSIPVGMQVPNAQMTAAIILFYVSWSLAHNEAPSTTWQRMYIKEAMRKEIYNDERWDKGRMTKEGMADMLRQISDRFFMCRVHLMQE
jgi:hypothetical protein